jgi:micrococcal nuclease
MASRQFARLLLALLAVALLSVGLALVRVILHAGAAEGEALHRVVRVVDGDTLIVETFSGHKERVRLIGVDTPELGREGRRDEFYARRATDCARRLLAGSKVTLESDPLCSDRDEYGRLLRYVRLPDGRLLNEELIKEGCGRAFTRFPFTMMRNFREGERRAREKKEGLWGR